MSVLTHRALEVLTRLAALPEGDEDAEILSAGGECYFGTERLSRATLLSLLRCAALSESWSTGSSTYYTLTSTGAAIARRPGLADEVLTAIHAGRSFSVVDDRVQLL
jgi:hypothetical protein